MTIKPRPRAHQYIPTSEGTILLREYMREIKPTDKLPQDDLYPVLMGLFSEVGSIMATAKKLLREDVAYAGYQQDVEEEFGDTPWYFTALCRRLRIDVDTLLTEAVGQDTYSKSVPASDLLDGPVSHISSISELPDPQETLLSLGEAAAALLGVKSLDKETRDLLRRFSDRYLQALQAANLNFSKIVHMNLVKARGRFLNHATSTLPTFDDKFPEEEQLPRQFEIKITQRKSGQCYLQWNGVFIGEPLTDNIRDPDGYRFHDVFHFAHAAILHWSPTFRALIKQKRKSDPKFDEAEDGGRAIVVEEGLTAWIFSRSKHLNFFDGQERLSFDLLKTVQQFVQGFEVRECPLRLWERAILDGYKVFRQVRNNNGGIVVADREARTIEYKFHR